MNDLSRNERERAARQHVKEALRKLSTCQRAEHMTLPAHLEQLPSPTADETLKVSAHASSDELPRRNSGETGGRGTSDGQTASSGQ
jgi:hypothetical protein